MKLKKILAVILALVLSFGLAACAKKNPPTDKDCTAPPEAEKKLGLEILKEEDDAMINNYTVIAVNDKAKWKDADGNAVKDVKINKEGADAFINWLLSSGLDLCKTYGKDKYGVALFTVKDDAPKSTAKINKATDENKVIRLSTTTSVNDSGLLSAILPKFEEEYGYKVEVYSAGTGKSIANAQMGNADVILVHAKSSEEDFVKAGYARVIDGMKTERLTFMYNYFVLCGPNADPAGVKSAADVKTAMASIAEKGKEGKAKFISRGDESGTHKAEIKLWAPELGITTKADSFKDYTDWYISANAGMGACIKMADEMGAYILTDKATFLTASSNYAEFLSDLDKAS